MTEREKLGFEENSGVGGKKAVSDVNSRDSGAAVVAVGASAGGLSALKALVEKLDEKNSLSIIIIQHLSPTQKSVLPELLAAVTKIPVQAAQNGLKIQSNRIYVNPPAKVLTIKDGVLQLQEKQRLQKVIDEFMFSLASEHNVFPIGVVLSGTGDDGTEGLRSIKASGGLTIVQDPASCQFPDMPQSVIDAGVADLVLYPEEIAAELNRFSQKSTVLGSASPQELALEDDVLKDVFDLLKSSFNVDFANYRRTTVKRRISRRMMLNNMESLEEYVEHLRKNKEELETLHSDLLISVTKFFREPPAFQALRDFILPATIKNKTGGQPIRIWVPACSTGEEVYSVAITLTEYLEETKNAGKPVQIYGTDINEKNVKKARKGLYLKNISRDVPQDTLKKFFVATKDGYEVSNKIREMCMFAKHDLTRDIPFSNMDIIFCRNLLIYFDTQTQEKVIATCHHALNPGGFLVLGESETVGKQTRLFEQVAPKGIYRKISAAPTAQIGSWQPQTAVAIEKPVSPTPATGNVNKLLMEVDNHLLGEYAPPTLVVDDNLDILAFRGNVSPYVSLEPGIATLNASKVLREELRAALLTAFFEAKNRKQTGKALALLERKEHTKTLNVQVKPFSTSITEKQIFLVTISELSAIAKERKRVKVSADKNQYLKELQDELDYTKEILRSTVEQQKSVEEELRAANEELQSTNEEVLTTNEELETAKEELSSANEELKTLNDELRERNETLTLLNNDLTNLMSNINTAILIVDDNCRLRRFNNAAATLMNLLPSDIGRPVTDLSLGISLDEFNSAMVTAVKGEKVRLEVQTAKGQYQMRIHPYLTPQQKPEGLVLALDDITELKLLEEKLNTIENFTRHDIKNKLTTLRGNLYLLTNALKGQPDAEKYLKKAAVAIEAIDRILDAAKIYHTIGSQKLEMTDVGETFNAASVFLDLKGVKLQNKAKGLKVLADQLLPVLFSNLIDNTLKYGEKTTQIKIYFEEHPPNSINLIYEDDGVGISFEDKEKLFQKGFGKGTGYGLYLIKRACEIYGWAIKETGEPGKGAKFVITIPQQKTALPAKSNT